MAVAMVVVMVEAWGVGTAEVRVVGTRAAREAVVRVAVVKVAAQAVGAFGVAAGGRVAM